MHESSMCGPHFLGLGKEFLQSHEGANRQKLVDYLEGSISCVANTFKATKPWNQITYREKARAPITFEHLDGDPLHLLSIWKSKLQGHTTIDSISYDLWSYIREFVTEAPLNSPVKKLLRPLSPNPKRFHTLDFAIVPRAWLPSILSSESKPHIAFPSDHFLVETRIKIKLGAKHKREPQPPKRDYSLKQCTPSFFADFNNTFRKHLGNQEPQRSMDHTADSTATTYYTATDGSGSSGRTTAHTRAGWGYAISSAEHDMQPEFLFEGHGPVVTDHRQPQFLGALVGSNNTGELTALCEALLFFLERGIVNARIVVVFDSKWAANMIRGHWKPKTNRQLVRTAQTILGKVQAHNTIEWKWVKGHQGHLLNDRADKNADKGKTTQHHTGGRHSNPSSAWLDPRAFTVGTPSGLTPSVARSSLEELSGKLDRALMQTQQLFPKVRKVPNKPWITQPTLDLIPYREI